MKSKWEYIPFCDAVEIWDTLRKPINSKERSARIEGKAESELYPYYGATGQVGLIDDYITDGEYVLLGEDGAPFLNSFAQKAYLINGKTRKLHPRECARIMGYPDSYKICKSSNQAYKQFGNSVVIDVLQFIAVEIGTVM